MINSNKCRNKNILGFAWKGIKTQGSSGGIGNVEIRVVQLLYHFVPTFFSLKTLSDDTKKYVLVQDIRTLVKNFNLPKIE